MRNAISIISTAKEHVEYIKELLKAQENNEKKTEEIILSTNQSYEKDRLGKVRTSNHEKYPQFLFCEVSENKEKRIIAVADFINLTDKEVTKDNKDKYNLILRNLRKVDKSSVLDCAVGDMVDNNNTSIPLKDLMDNACNGTTRFYITWPEYWYPNHYASYYNENIDEEQTQWIKTFIIPTTKSARINNQMFFLRFSPYS